MTDTQGQKRNRLVIILCAIVFASSMIGLFTYVAHLQNVNDERAKLTANVCTRQDDIIDVLAYLVSPERQNLIQSVSSSDLKASNEVIRALVRKISASPC